MAQKTIKNKISFFSFFIIGILVLPVFAFGQSCPNLTTVEGTNVTFVGELSDMGGDINTSVWFEYGQTSNYGRSTNEKKLTQTGFYCITVSGLSPCTTYYYRTAARNSAGTSYGENKTFTTTCGSPLPSVDLKINGIDGPITLLASSSAVLSWTTTNAISCFASGDWSGQKSLSGSESTGILTSNKQYLLTCYNGGNSISDKAVININTLPSSLPSLPSLTIEKLVANLSDGTPYLDSVEADPGEVISFSLKVKEGAGKEVLSNVVLKDVLPEKMGFLRKLKVDGIPFTGDIAAGLNLGNFLPNQSKTVTFEVLLSESNQFPFGETTLVNTGSVFASSLSHSDTAKIIVKKRAVAGIATSIPTGLTNNLFFDSFLIPFIIALIIVWLFKSRIINFEKWLDSRRKNFQEYKTNKLLQLKVKEIKSREFPKS